MTTAEAAEPGRHRVRILWGPAIVLAITAFLTAILLLTNHDDPSYSCRHNAIVGVFNPEPEDAPGGIAFDSGHACNRDARLHVGGAAVVLVSGGFLTWAWMRRRRSNR